MVVPLGVAESHGLMGIECVEVGKDVDGLKPAKGP